jgi:molybdate/tungstate transport system permease protein
LASADFPGKHLVEGIINLPIVVPHTAAGIALLMVLGRQSLLGRLPGWQV